MKDDKIIMTPSKQQVSGPKKRAMVYSKQSSSNVSNNRDDEQPCD